MVCAEPCPQPANWTEPGVYDVVPGIRRIVLPLPLDGLSAVNVYVLETSTGLVLVDSGWAWEPARTALEQALAGIGLAVSDIERFVITHAHWDHYSLAAAVRRETGAVIAVGAGERSTFEDFDYECGIHAGSLALLGSCGADQLAATVRELPLESYEVDVPFEPADEWLAEGDVIALLEGELQVIETPGHTRGHIVLRHTLSGAFLTGDHILPTITPALGVEATPQRRPLAAFLDSLELILQRDDGALLPAHGPISASTHTRASELLAHHEERLEEVLTCVARGEDNPLDIAAGLRWTKHGRQLDELAPVHQMTAVLEINAHLDVLVDRGAVTASAEGAGRRFSAA